MSDLIVVDEKRADDAKAPQASMTQEIEMEIHDYIKDLISDFAAATIIVNEIVAGNIPHVKFAPLYRVSRP